MPTMTTKPGRRPRTAAKHEELTQTLLDLLDTLQPGDRFPSQTELMRQYRVSDRTVLRSLDDLRQAGRIVRRHGVGTFVTARDTANGSNGSHASDADRSVGARTIAGLSTSLSPFFRHCIERMAEIAADAGLSLLCHHVRMPVQFEDALPLEALHPRGFILFTHHLMPVAHRLMERGHRVVVIGTPPVDTLADAPNICGDQEQGGYLATHHLIEKGHRRLGFVDMSEATAVPLLQRPRWRGHERALNEARAQGISVTTTLLGHEQIDPMRAAPENAHRFFADASAPTGLICLNDPLALMMLALLARAGVHVPEEVSVIGYDNLPETVVSHPPLTTIEQFIETQLRTALDLLIRPTAPPASYTVIIPPALKERASVSVPKSY
jgi:DNA-binding LacI/PurR family transcriptional regulator